MTFGKEGEDDASLAGSPRTRINGDTVLEDEREKRLPTPAPDSDFPAVKKRKSGTFWRRKSSLGLGTSLGENGGTGMGQNSSPNTNGEHSMMDRGRGEDAVINGQGNGESPTSDEMSKIQSTRSASPPPQIPMFVGGGIGLGGEDLFKDIH